MKNLTLSQLEKIIKNLKARQKAIGKTTKEIGSIPIILGDDEEFNGAHNCFFAQSVAMCEKPLRYSLEDTIQENCYLDKGTDTVLLLS